MTPMSLVLFLLVTLANVRCDKYGDAVPASVTHLSAHKYQIEVQMPGNDPKVVRPISFDVIGIRQ